MALQASPRTQTAIPPDAFASEAPTSRHHYNQQSPTLPDNSRSPNSAHSSSRRPSRQRSGNNTSQPATPQQTQHRSPNSNANSSGSTARPTTTQPSPRTPTTATASQAIRREPHTEYGQEVGSMIVAPPRTSSNQRNATSAAPMESTIPDRSRRRTDVQGGEMGDDQLAGPGLGQSSASATARRPVPSSPGDVKRSASTKETRRQQASAVRSEPNSDGLLQRPADVTRENSEVLNRLIVTDPQVDVAREMERQAESVPAAAAAAAESPATPLTRADTEGSREQNSSEPKSRQNFSTSASKRKETKFGDYVLGQTLGEGEFGKVKLGWKKDGSVEVAIKLIRRENLNTNPSRLPKIYREISILRGLAHPNIVRLHEMVETERHIGIILEYASGGELFDYILRHRYLKDNAARRLFAQLVSGVGYLHKKGIVHRDLKLENLLLDRNRNIIITDFGFANTFDPRDELGEEIEFNLTNRDFVKRMGLEQVHNGVRRGDLMQTSCGSPCYAAPELVVTDSLYTGRKVDVWSCGVILYAMLAGYLPFDDDPANPEGDNINLLYKYIVSTPLTFPEYVSPHSRDLLRRILVPDPRKRADLFEVARHSWLSEYAHVVVHVTSSTTTIGDIANATVTDDYTEAPHLARSASVREPSKAHATLPSALSPVGGLSHQGKLDDSEKSRARADAKRRTVQVEYVAPQSQTVRGEMSPAASETTPERRIGSSGGPPGSRGQASERSPRKVGSAGGSSRKPLPPDPATIHQSNQGARLNQKSNAQTDMRPPSRPVREPPRSVSDSTSAFGQVPIAVTTIARPNTGGSMSSGGGGRLPSRGNSYGQPIAPTVAATNAQGRLAQPKGTRTYNISAPIPHPEPYISDVNADRPVSQRVPARYSQQQPSASADAKGHKRANTFGNVFSRSGSLFGGRSQPQSPAEGTRPSEKKYPPTSMKNAIAADSPRQSSESRRPSFTFNRKNSDLSRQERQERQEKPRRFSLLPASFSFKAMTGGSKDQQQQSVDSPRYSPDQKLPNIPSSEYRGATSAGDTTNRFDGGRDQHSRHASAPLSSRQPPRSAPHPSQQPAPSPRYPSAAAPTVSAAPYTNANWQQQQPPLSQPSNSYRYNDAADDSTPSFSQQPQTGGVPQQSTLVKPRYPPGFNENEHEPSLRPSLQQVRAGRVLQKPNRKFTDAYEQEQEAGHHSGSSGAARRVMDFFRRRGKARSGE